jgi:hypothetical protein
MKIQEKSKLKLTVLERFFVYLAESGGSTTNLKKQQRM